MKIKILYCREIVKTLTDQIQADVPEIQPADKGQKYEANNYAIGSKLLNDIEMPILGYGVFQVSPAECERCVADALNTDQ